MTLQSFKENYDKVINEQDLIRCLSLPKLDTYRKFSVSGSTKDAIIAYTNTQVVSSFLFPLLQYFEVTLRNRVHTALCNYFKKRPNTPQGYAPEEWLFWLPQAKTTKDFIVDARNKASQDIRRRRTHVGDIISRLSLGTWVAILKEQPAMEAPLHFWTFTSKDIFPNAPKRERKFIIDRLDEINKIRNRLFHFEPIWNTKTCSDIEKLLDDIIKKNQLVMETIEWMSKDAAYVLKELGHADLVEHFCDALRGAYHT